MFERSDNQSVVKNEFSAKIFNSFKRIVFDNQFKQRFNKSLLEVNLKPKCSQSLRALSTKPEEEWVQLMLESSGRLPLGMMSGTTFSFGDYDQCLAINGKLNNKTVIRGKYCLMKIGLPLHSKGSKVNSNYSRIFNGICIPSVCSQTEITQFLGRVLGELRLNIIVDNCSEKTDRISLDWPQLISIILITFSVIAVMIGTIFDRSMTSSAVGADNESPSHHRSNRMKSFLLCFSIKENSKRIFTINENSGEKELACLDGLRVFSCLWVTISHTLIFPIRIAIIPANIFAHFTLESFIKDPLYAFMANAMFSVQTFFIIGGVVSLHVVLKMNKNKPQHMSFISSIIIRWTRFILSILVLYCIQFILPLLGSGPLFNRKMLSTLTDKCYKYWWTHLLLISNWFSADKQCVEHTWYLSADFQINLLSYFLIVYYLKNYSKATELNIALILIGVILPIVIIYICKFSLVNVIDPNFQNVNVLYPKWKYHTYHHLVAYFIGILLAAIINSDYQLTLSNISTKIIWMFVILTMVFNLFTMRAPVHIQGMPDYLEHIIFSVVKRFLWSVDIGWIILACAMFNKQGVLSKFLSANIFQVLSRLSFSVYLIHPFIIYYDMFVIRQPHLMNTWSMLMRCLGVVLLSLILGFIFHIIFEAPVVNVLKLIIGRKTQSKRKTNEINRSDEKQEKVD